MITTSNLREVSFNKKVYYYKISELMFNNVWLSD